MFGFLTFNVYNLDIVSGSEEYNIRLGRRIAERRAIAGLTQIELAKLIRRGRTTLANIEVGKQGVSAQLLHEIADALGVRADDILGRRVDEIPAPTLLGKEQWLERLRSQV